MLWESGIVVGEWDSCGRVEVMYEKLNAVEERECGGKREVLRERGNAEGGGGQLL